MKLRRLDPTRKLSSVLRQERVLRLELMKTHAGHRAHAALIPFAFGISLLFSAASARAQNVAAESEPPPAGSQAGSRGKDWCSLPLCRDAEGLRQAGDLQGTLKLYRYIQDEVDVDEKVVEKKLLWFPIASLYSELQQPQQGLLALQKYQLYIGSRPDSELPVGQRREDVERLAQKLRTQESHVRIGTTVPGLRVSIDGKPVGVTPISQPLPVASGRHRIEISDAQSDVQDVEVAAGQELLIWPVNSEPRRTLALTGGVDTSHKPRPRWRIAVGVVGIGVGVTMAAVGVAALGHDGQCVSGDARGQCPIEVNGSGVPVMRVVDGRATGGGLLAAGILLSAAGSILIAVPGKKIPLAATVAFHSGASLGLAGAF